MLHDYDGPQTLYLGSEPVPALFESVRFSQIQPASWLSYTDLIRSNQTNEF